jgi:hypothetical protein
MAGDSRSGRPAAAPAWGEPWRRWRSLTGPERRGAIEAAGVLPLAVAGLRLLGLPRLMRLVEAAVPAGPPRSAEPSPDDLQIERTRVAVIARGADIAARRGLVRPACLGRSVGLWWLLRWHRLPAELRLGVRREAEQLEAHAWVEHRGMVLLDQAEVVERFAVLGPAAGTTPTARRMRPPPASTDTQESDR